MLSRRILASACALALFVPAAATAMPPHDPPAAFGGPTVATATPPHDQPAVGPADTTSDLQVPARGSQSLDGSPSQLAAAYGRTNIDAKPVAPTRAGIVSSNDGSTNGWRTAAVIEAGVLAAFAVAAAVLLTGRQRRPRMGL
jgi:hypothetical protein